MALYEDAVTDSVRRAMEAAPLDDELATITGFTISVLTRNVGGTTRDEAVVSYGGDPTPATRRGGVTRQIDASKWITTLSDNHVNDVAHATIHYDHTTRIATYVVIHESKSLLRHQILDSGQIIFNRAQR